MVAANTQAPPDDLAIEIVRDRALSTGLKPPETICSAAGANGGAAASDQPSKVSAAV